MGSTVRSASPALAQRIRDDIEDLLSPRHAELARMLHELRWGTRRGFPPSGERRDAAR